MKRDNIKVEGHIGTFYVIKEVVSPIGRLHLLESELYGEDAPCLWVDSACRVILDNVWNGVDDLDEYLESRGIK